MPFPVVNTVYSAFLSAEQMSEIFGSRHLLANTVVKTYSPDCECVHRFWFDRLPVAAGLYVQPASCRRVQMIFWLCVMLDRFNSTHKLHLRILFVSSLPGVASLMNPRSVSANVFSNERLLCRLNSVEYVSKIQTQG